MSKKVWITGKVKSEEEYLHWEFQGVFTTEEAAVAACVTDLHFVGPAILDNRLPEDNAKWEGSYYPSRL